MKFKVEDMTCNHCKMRIEEALGNAGIESVRVDLENKIVETGAGMTDQQIIDLLDETGYTAVAL